MSLPQLLTWIVSIAALLISGGVLLYTRRFWKKVEHLHHMERRATRLAYAKSEPGALFDPGHRTEARGIAVYILTGQWPDPP